MEPSQGTTGVSEPESRGTVLLGWDETPPAGGADPRPPWQRPERKAPPSNKSDPALTMSPVSPPRARPYETPSVPNARDMGEPAPPESMGLWEPIRLFGRVTWDATLYLGGLKILAWSAVRSLWLPSVTPGRVSFRYAWLQQVSWILAMGLPLAFLTHMALGGFLAMQAYYGATFVLAAGPVVLIGVFRDTAPLLTGFLLAGLMGTRMTSDLLRHGFQVSPSWLTAVRVAAAMSAGPVLALVSALSGTFMGAVMSQNHLGVPIGIFLENGWRMVWLRDIVGLAVKSSLFGGVTALLACYEGLRLTSPMRPVAWSCYRACLIGLISVLLINTSWFVLLYKAGPAFGPTVLKPPVP